MQTKKILIFALIMGALFALVFSSCSGGKIGYGVVLWSADKSPVSTGQVVTIKSQSKINNTYAVEVSGAKSPVDIPTWRIKLFSNEKDALNFSASYSPMIPLFAKATTNGAPIRDKPDAAATRVYRLRQGQVIKVISKEPNKVTIDGIDGYWYQVLTNDGVLGYSFDANLQVYNPSDQSQQQKTSVGQLQLNDILSTTYRPQYFQQMIDNNRIDLKKFQPQFGFFADPKANKVRIVMPKYNLTFNYTDIKEVGTNDYTFEGTSLEMIAQSPDKIRLLYSDSKGNQYDQTFVKISQDIGFLIEKEKNRRLQLYSNFLDKTPFSSDYYGKIDLGPNMGFTWKGFSRLVPDIIPAGSGSTGIVDFPLYLSDSLKGQYDGVISFVFGATPVPGSGPASAQQGSTDGTKVASIGSGAPGPSGGGTTPQGNGQSAGSSASSSSGQSSGDSVQSGSTDSQTGQTSSALTQPNGNYPTVNFLYSFADGGVKLTYVPPNTITDDTVTGVSSTPIIIFFSFDSSKG